MTDLEIQEGICRVQSRFEEILYKLKGNSSDGIENLSDLKAQYTKKVSENYDQNYSYDSGIITSYLNNIYISRVNSNLGNLPNISLTEWKKIDVKNLNVGEFYASAIAYIQQDVSNTNNFDNFNIQSSWNVTSFTNLGNGYFKMSFDPNAGLTDTNYLVMQSGSCNYFIEPAAPSVPVFWEASVVQKSETYIIIRIPWDRFDQQFSIAIVPIQ